MKLNDYNYALEQFNQGISLSQNSGTSMENAESFSEVLQEMRFNQIVCYEKLGDWENAKTKIAEYIQVYPDVQMPREKQNFWRPDKEYKGRRGYADCGEDSAVSVLYSRG